MTPPQHSLSSGGEAVQVTDIALPHRSILPEQVAGEPTTTASVEVGRLGDATFGVWEMNAGVMCDVEEEEVFIVTAGHGTVTIEEIAGESERTVKLAPGVLMRLSRGMKTTWHISENLRKVYFTL